MHATPTSSPSISPLTSPRTDSSPTSSPSPSPSPYPSRDLLRTATILESLVDGAIVIDVRGIICFVNRSTEKLFQYTRDELVGKNVSLLMPETYARQHDRYLKRYLRTGKQNVIGTSRNLPGVRRDGSRVTLWLTISEHKTWRDHGFIATIREDENENENENNNNSNNTNNKNNDSIEDPTQLYNVMENLMEASLVTNHRGIIVFLNKAAAKLLEFNRDDLIGSNIKTIFPPACIDNDEYLADYVQTGGRKLSRRVHDTVMQRKHGSMAPVSISMSHDLRNDGREYFVAILREREEAQDMNDKSRLQQEREVIDNLALPGIIMDDSCHIQGFNQVALQALGYSLVEVLGKNVKMLIPPGEIRDHHDSYIERYLRTGEAKIIGTAGREVTAQAKDGSLVDVLASVTERRLKNDRRIFTAILHPK